MAERPVKERSGSEHTRSIELQESANEYLPESTSSNVRGRSSFEPYSSMIFMESGDGATLTDVDGNRYVDLHCAVSSIIVGHRPDEQVAAVREQIEERGPYFSTAYEHEQEAAELLVDTLPAVDKVKFTSTGTEAVMNAIHLARAYTGKEKVLKFEGMYHGHSDYMLMNVHPKWEDLGTRRNPSKLADSAGIPPSTQESVESLPWNDIDLVAEKLEREGDEIAAIITEGLLSNSGLLYPKENYLHQLQSLAREHDVLFILDEVITGFRVGLQGVMGEFDLEPDLAVYGKGLANGYPCAAMGGREEVMNFIGGTPETADFMGTFSGNPIATAATKVNLEILQRIGQSGYDELHDKGQRLVEGLRETAADADCDVYVPDFAGYSHVYFVDGDTNPEEWTGWRDIDRYDDPTKWGKFAGAMIDEGVYIVPRPWGRFNLSHAHTDAHVDEVLEAAKTAFGQISE